MHPIEFFLLLSFALKLLGFLTRDVLRLRILVSAGFAANIVFYFLATDAPIWSGVVTNAVLVGGNLLMIALLIYDRSTWQMTEHDRQFARYLPALLPGQLRWLLKRCDEEVLEAPKELTKEGAVPEKLYFLREGVIVLEKQGQTAEFHGPAFVGELGFLAETPASATVVAQPGAHLVSWEAARLRKALDRRRELSNALRAEISRDVAKKLGVAMPVSA